jgi:hypothetical protein
MKTLCFCFILLLFCTCKKNEVDALPPLTMEGKNTFGCLIDGKAYVPNGGSGYNADKAVDGGYQGELTWKDIKNCVWIQTNNKDGSGMDIWLRNVERIGDYPLNFDTGVSPAVILPKNYGYYYGKNYNYITTTQYTGKVNIVRADTINKVVSGTFEFTGYDSNTKRTISITDGRFDIKYRP